MPNEEPRTEIERKFRLKFAPGELQNTQSILIEQGYIFSSDSELRVRRSGGVLHTITVKGEGTLERPEWETEIPQWVFDTLWTKCNHTLRKLRTLLPTDRMGTKYEVDQFLDTLDGLILLEIEFQSVEQAENFVLPRWADRALEVTEDSRYKNKNLAMMQSYEVSDLLMW
jgi:CYTH domain-containing protein